jgi:hypothetical protein
MRRDGAELMERNKQWQLTVGAGWNRVAGDSGDFRRKLTEVWGAFEWICQRRGGGFLEGGISASLRRFRRQKRN